MLADDGGLLGHAAVLDDLTEHKETATALADARRQADEHLQAWEAAEKQSEEAVHASTG